MLIKQSLSSIYLTFCFATPGSFFLRESAIESDISPHHLESAHTRAAHLRRYLKYKCSIIRNRMDKHTPQPNRKKADMNWAKANGLLEDFFLSPGLHAPVNQNLWSRSRSPFSR